MITYLYADELTSFPKLKSTMYQDRATQFRDRLKWDVSVDENGFERDEYDRQNPLYVIWKNQKGEHGGSMRFLPTTGDTMVNDHFLDLTGGVRIQSPLIWETTRFCLSPGAKQEAGHIAATLMMAGCQLGLSKHLSHAVGVFDARMVRVYQRMGWCPEILGSSGLGRERVSVGLWEFSTSVLTHLSSRSGVSAELSHYWYQRSFGGIPQAQSLCA